jgi:hypothetical protein
VSSRLVAQDDLVLIRFAALARKLIGASNRLGLHDDMQ